MLRISKRNLFLAISILMVVLCLIYATTTRYKSLYAAVAESFQTNSFKRNNTKVLLYWTPFWTTWHYFMGYGFDPFRDCEYKNCYATKNRSLIPLEEFDALLFHAVYSKKDHGVPWIRLPHQIYIFMNIEAPATICPNLKQYASYFNWTMTYRYDSEIIRRHGFFFKKEMDYKMPTKEFIQNKTKLAAWMVSNCRTSGHREELAKEIQKFLEVDIYGSCGRLSCPRKKGDGKISSVECYDMIEKNYKFYFSWENAYCKDYATEKLYNLLVRDVVPVVYGAGNYQRGAPPHSVINVEDFESASKLADYLHYLDGNTDEYLKYFEWKKHYNATSSAIYTACQICKKLHEPLKQSIYYDLHTWWWGYNNSVCKLGKSLPKINVQKLAQVYESPDDVDLTVGGSLEKLVPGTLAGPVFLCILTEQFYRTRAGDRYFYENAGQSGFSLAQLNEIRKASISRLFCDNANHIKSMQPRGFERVSHDNVVVPCESLPAIDLTLWQENGGGSLGQSHFGFQDTGYYYKKK